MCISSTFGKGTVVFEQSVQVLLTMEEEDEDNFEDDGYFDDGQMQDQGHQRHNLYDDFDQGDDMNYKVCAAKLEIFFFFFFFFFF